LVEPFQQHILLVREVSEEGPLGHAGARRYLLYRNRIEAAFQEHREGRFAQLLSHGIAHTIPK
jgi:hypothetical protein